jgi:predicted kinase
MATVAQRTQAVEERVDRLEITLTRFMARTDESMARTDESVARTDRMVERLGGIVERMEREGARGREAAARERREMNKRWGELANKMGTVVEDIVAPSVRRLAREVFDCGDLQSFITRGSFTRSDDRSRAREFDALYVGSRAVLLNETKSSPRADDARAFTEFLRSGEFALYFPQYKDLPIVPAFSSLSIPDDMVTYLTRRGIYALAMGGEAMQVLNLETVRSRQAAR